MIGAQERTFDFSGNGVGRVLNKKQQHQDQILLKKNLEQGKFCCKLCVIY